MQEPPPPAAPDHLALIASPLAVLPTIQAHQAQIANDLSPLVGTVEARKAAAKALSVKRPTR